MEHDFLRECHAIAAGGYTFVHTDAERFIRAYVEDGEFFVILLFGAD